MVANGVDTISVSALLHNILDGSSYITLVLIIPKPDLIKAWEGSAPSRMSCRLVIYNKSTITIDIFLY